MSGPLKIGAEPRKVAALAGLLVLAVGIYFWNSRDSNGPTASGKAAAPPRAALKRALQNPQGAEPEAEAAAKTASPTAAEAARDFRPTMKRKSDEAANPEQFDPTLRTDLLDKLASVRIEAVQRSLFDFSNSAAPAHAKLPDPRIEVQAQHMIGPELPPPPPAPPVKPPPPPITLKFYGRALPLKGGVKRVFCLINDEVKIPAEGDVLQRRYKIRRIMPTSVLVEDLQSANQQTLPIEEPVPGSQ